MAWNDSPPTAEELAAAKNDWAASPPTEAELRMARGEEEPGLLSKGLHAVGQGLDAINIGKRLGAGDSERASMDSKVADLLAKYQGVSPELAMERAQQMSGLAESGGSLAGSIENVASKVPSVGSQVEQAVQKASDYIAPKIEGAIGGSIENVAGGLGKKANNLRANATNLTPAQVVELGGSQQVGKILKPYTNFGSNAEGIAANLESGVGAANSKMASALAGSDAAGVKVNVDAVVQELEQKIAALKKNPSQADQVSHLQKIVDNIYQTGESEIPALLSEETKQGFQAGGNYKTSGFDDAAKSAAYKEAARPYMRGTENAMQAAEAEGRLLPQTTETFKAGKQEYKALNPTLDAMQTRLMGDSQRGGIGFKDIASAVAGGKLGLATHLATKGRVASSGAVALDKIADIVSQAPHLLGKFAKPLAAAAERGPRILAANDFMLQQTSPEYRETLRKIREGNSGDNAH